MVIAFQKSCFVGPINPADGLRKHFPQRKTPKKRLVRQREHQMRTVVRETRIWALASALPMTTYFAEVGLTTETEFLGKRIFGPHITERKIRAVFAKIGLDLLAEDSEKTIREQTLDQVKHNALTEVEIEALSNNRIIPQFTIREILGYYPQLKDRVHDRGMTWAAVRQAAKDTSHQSTSANQADRRSMSSKREATELCSRLSWFQQRFAHRELAPPRLRSLDLNAQSEFDRWLRHWDAERWNHDDVEWLALGFKDTFAVRAVPKQLELRLADINISSNYITLYPLFFESSELQSVKGMKLTPGATRLQSNRENWPEILMHEITHSESCLHTEDMTLTIPTRSLGAPTPTLQLGLCAQDSPAQQAQTQVHKVYGDELVFYLGAYCICNNKNVAE